MLRTPRHRAAGLDGALFSVWVEALPSAPCRSNTSGVSTRRQGRSGLGLEAQQNAVRDHLNGGDWRIVAEFTEVESGTRPGRPKLVQALKTCRALGATLIIAKLDRLARNVHFVSGLMEPGVEFTAVDFPQANRLTVHILAAVAEHEAKMISERTRVALAAAKRGAASSSAAIAAPDFRLRLASRRRCRPDARRPASG
jgi:DNA invertase Pin-like site-specific DNA recombinase